MATLIQSGSRDYSRNFAHSAIIFVTLLFSSINFFNGFGARADSIRILLAAEELRHYGRLIPSRSWGYPLYENIIYRVITHFNLGIELAKLFSLMCSILTVEILFIILKKIGLSNKNSFLFCFIFICSPIIILTSNSVIETSLSLLTLTGILWYVTVLFYCRTGKGNDFLIWYDYILYGFLFGIATLTRPDNIIYFPALFLYLILFRSRSINYMLTLVSVIILFIIGILPYYILKYPIFKSLSVPEMHSPIFVGVKNILAIFGLPMVVFISAIIILIFKLKINISFKSNTLHEKNASLIKYLILLFCATLCRSFIRADQLEYSIAIWLVFILLMATFLQIRFDIINHFKYISLLSASVVLTFIPNIVEIYFFKGENYHYHFSVGFTNGVFAQERERRILNSELYDNGEKLLMEASKNYRRDSISYSYNIVNINCSNCVILTDLRSFEANNNKEPAASKNNKIFFTLNFNVSQGWRNFIQDEKMPHLSIKNIVFEKSTNPLE
jgi:hypothetical protein